MIYHNQRNYAHVAYPCASIPNATVKSGGCGVCCASIVVDNLTGVSCPPSKMAKTALACGARVNGGTDMAILAKHICKAFLLSCATTSSEDDLLAHLREGHAAICNVAGDTGRHKGIFSTGGHYVVAVGLAQDGRVMVLDPGMYTGKYAGSYRKKLVEVQGDILLCSIDTLEEDTAGRVPNYYLFKGEKRMPFWRNGAHVREYTPETFRLLWWDAPKKTGKLKNYCNANFFCQTKVGGAVITEPAGNLVADIDLSRYSKAIRAKLAPLVSGGKARYGCNDTWSTQFDGKNITTLVNTGEWFLIGKYHTPPAGAAYAVSGMPVMLSGKDVSWSRDVLPEGWGTGPVYATWHIVLGITADGQKLYRIAVKTTTANCIRSSELYRTLKALNLGITDALLLDGGGSTVVDENGRNVVVTPENRRINCVIW